MKPFHFPLKSLRVVREQKERAAQKRFVEAMRASDEAAAKLDAGTHELSAAWMALCKQVEAGTTISKLQHTRAWCGELERRCSQLAAALKSAERAVHEARREMVSTSRDREALDRMHDKRRRDYDREVQRDEQKRLDEMGLRLNYSTPALGEAITTNTEQS
jgi:flagellar FliJ protein